MITNLFTLSLLSGDAGNAAHQTIGAVCDYAELIPTQTVVWQTLVWSVVVCSLLWFVLTRYTRSRLAERVDRNCNRGHRKL
jgi:hypothetical protein